MCLYWKQPDCISIIVCLLCRLYVIKFNNLFDILSLATGTRARAYISELHNFFFRSNFNLHREGESQTQSHGSFDLFPDVLLFYTYESYRKNGHFEWKNSELVTKIFHSFQCLHILRLYEHVKKFNGKIALTDEFEVRRILEFISVPINKSLMSCWYV